MTFLEDLKKLLYYTIIIILLYYILPYAPGELQMEPGT
jgi:hypothetical protein